MYGCETWKMNKSDENKINVFQSKCLRKILKLRWQERIKNKEVLQMADIDNLSEDMRRRRWKFIGHIMSKEPNNDCRTALTCTPEGRRNGADQRQRGGGWQREKGNEPDGDVGVRDKSQQLTGLVGGIIWPHVPHDTKKIGEGEGEGGT